MDLPVSAAPFILRGVSLLGIGAGDAATENRPRGMETAGNQHGLREITGDGRRIRLFRGDRARVRDPRWRRSRQNRGQDWVKAFRIHPQSWEMIRARYGKKSLNRLFFGL
jgi:hypothetical protein